MSDAEAGEQMEWDYFKKEVAEVKRDINIVDCTLNAIAQDITIILTRLGISPENKQPTGNGLTASVRQNTEDIAELKNKPKIEEEKKKAKRLKIIFTVLGWAITIALSIDKLYNFISNLP